MFRPFFVLAFKVFGWKVVGRMPDIPKFIIGVAPHTSNWDFLVGVAARSILRIRNAQFLGKSQLFKPPFGWFFRWLGGHPVDRASSHDMVDQVVRIFNAHEKFILALAPEGTRRKVTKLRTGFYYIAKGAKVPIVPVGFDFSRKEVIVKEPFFPGDDTEKDMATLLQFYRSVTGKNPELGLE